MSLAKTIAALEEFTEDVNSEIVAEQPIDGAFDGETAGVNYQDESSDIDDDMTSITTAAQGLEDIVSLIEDAPGEDDAPLEPFVEKSINVALESNDLVAVNGNPAEGEKTKAGALEKVKEFAQKVWDMLRNFGKKIAAWIRETWTKFTDRIVKNTAKAQKIIDATTNLSSKADAKITDKSLLEKVATFQNTDIGDALIAVSEHANEQGGKATEALTKECRTCIDAVASGASTTDSVMERFVDALLSATEGYDDEATAEQISAIKAAANAKVVVTKPFFGGYRGWATIPEGAEDLAKWNHGITKIDQVKPQDSITAPNGEEIKAIAEYIVGLGTLVKIYQNNIKSLDDLNKALDSAASKAKNAKTESTQLKAMQAVVPRIIKGPQVDAYAYATSASTIALQFCEAAIAAHRGEKKGGEPSEDKVKGAFGKKAE